ncbi:transcription initiation factor TFIID complex 60 kDa subunit [Lentinula detonsa]|uniref:Transcription initiation factor TFIID complex 60 kDa subunit n=2 Tax=Lentinula TaxID=5352 RepID=A0A9W8NSP9_9AGAR|nr:transcription initiation factor TFIID complex 60 kDa subunit [Lentinula detonsa]KAJ3786754.1 transcription initiation factor TFIID complex 60 kDa subunit [Lentinula aff. detonsa]KAJ3797520.1 transcription initiation factor TFIID complex 60 kDa subunit [Lentinula aff. detonsa]KAJ3981714.1 transcription initiation factor TFIID complex 60 kDa subunit [Lentinula detonsa]
MATKPPKARTGQLHHTGVYKADSIKDLAEMLNINISDAIATALASDVEYRIHQVVEEAAKFMRHGRRTTMSTSDIEQALRVLNIEPLYGHTTHNPPTFRRAAPAYNAASSGSAISGAVYFVEDEEIDFDRVLREEKIIMPKGVSWTAHWLAVEGVQPLTPENPPPVPRDVDVSSPETSKPNGVVAAPSAPPLTMINGTGIANNIKKPQQQQQTQQHLVKQVLSRELQLYYTRLTSSLLPPSSDFAKRTAALASLRSDAGLQALLPYLIRWVGEGVVGALKEGGQTESDGKVLEVLMEVIGSILENNTLFVEPYLHQLLPPLLSTLLHSSLPRSHSTQLRTISSQTLSGLLTKHSTTYPSLSPRIMKTLLLALISPGKSKGTREGAIRGLIGVGKEAVRKGLVESGGAKVVGIEVQGHEMGDWVEDEALTKSIMDALRVLRPPSDSEMSEALNLANDADLHISTRLRDVLGEFFAQKVEGDAAWARAILGENNNDDLVMGHGS